MTPEPDLLVAADDRTGALETAGALADAGWGRVPVVVAAQAGDEVRRAAGGAGAIVVDLGTRHRADEAGARAAATELLSAHRHGHKIDSALRGNWPIEVVSRHRAGGRPVLVVAALPALGRTCVHGVVLDRGVPVHETPAGRDARAPVGTSRPAELLARAGTRDVPVLSGEDAVASWFRAPHGVAVADAASERDLDAIGRRWSEQPGVLLAGTSAALAVARPPAATGAATSVRHPARDVLVVCGSVHPAARAQLERAIERGAVVVDDDDVDTGRLAGNRAAEVAGAPRVRVIRSPEPGGQVSDHDADAMSAALARRAGRALAAASADVLVVIGGDTAAAVLGADVVDVHGSLARGTPWGTRRSDGTTVVTRAGSFGGPDALVELVWGTLWG